MGRLFLIDHLLAFCRFGPSWYGPVLRVRRRDWTNRAAFFGSYGAEIPDQVRTLSPPDVFLDIGANTGVFSLLASTVVSDGFVFAFEPNPVVFADLCANIRVNGAANVTALNVGLSDADGVAALETREGHSGVATVRMDGEGTRVVLAAPGNIAALAVAMKDRRAGIKIDVEGHELQVLLGLRAAGYLDRAKWIIVEIDRENLERHGASARGVYQLLEARNFRPRKGRIDSVHYDEIFVRS